MTTPGSTTAAAAERRPIRRLPDSVVTRIAAGEVVQRPAHAAKELIENSLDAGATAVRVTVADGGLAQLSVADDGHGIAPDDLPLACQRFATSKLRRFDDLRALASYGFRGEALAALSHVARVTITSMVRGAACAYTAAYADGEVVPPRPGHAAAPAPCAGTPGTTVTAADLFHNTRTRRNAMGSPADEYARVADVVARYAVHNIGVAFALRKAAGATSGATAAGISVAQDLSRVDRIRQIYGAPVARELLELDTTIALEDTEVTVNAHLTNPNYSTKKFTFLLFINNRAVVSPNLKRALDALYAQYLPKGMHPFVFLSLVLPPHHIDVNVHPTKEEVHFLYETELTERIVAAIEDVLRSANASRHYAVQTLLPTVPSDSTPSAKKRTQGPSTMVRTDARATTLDQFLVPVATCQPPSSDQLPSQEQQQPEQDAALRDLGLASVARLLDAYAARGNAELRARTQQLVLVGHVTGPVYVAQHGTDLYLVDTRVLARNWVYQRALRYMGNYARVPCDVDLAQALQDAAENIPGFWDGAPTHVPREQVLQAMAEQLEARADLLDDYFSLSIRDHRVVATPCVVVPSELAELPQLLAHLAADVDWTAEEPCLDGVCRLLAQFTRPAIPDVFRTMCTELVPDDGCAGAFVAVANLHELYKVFERC